MFEEFIDHFLKQFEWECELLLILDACKNKQAQPYLQKICSTQSLQLQDVLDNRPFISPLPDFDLLLHQKHFVLTAIK